MHTNHIKGYFYTGLIALLPIIITGYIFNWLLKLMIKILTNSFVTIIINDILIKTSLETEKELYFHILVYLLSIITIFIGICFVGFTMKIVFFARIGKTIQKLVIKIPIIKQIYTTINQIIEVMIVDKNSIYKQVVLIEYPRKGLYSIGFLTAESNNKIVNVTLNSTEKMYNIFIPTSPNPTSGMFIIANEKDVYFLDISAEDAIKMIVSGGVVLPAAKKMKESK